MWEQNEIGKTIVNIVLRKKEKEKRKNNEINKKILSQSNYLLK
jgi:hypothetical protein